MDCTPEVIIRISLPMIASFSMGGGAIDSFLCRAMLPRLRRGAGAVFGVTRDRNFRSIGFVYILSLFETIFRY